jgi:hypothetical protein
MSTTTLNPKHTTILKERFSLALPYPDRQRIVIVPDDQVEAERRVRAGLADEPAIITPEGEYASVAEGPAESPAAIVTKGLQRGLQGMRGAGGEVKRTFGDRVAKRAARRRTAAVMVPRSESDVIRFDSGHPLSNVLYVGHPGRRELYFPAADFHRQVFEHKFVQAVNLLRSLGASRIVVEQVQGYAREEERNIDLPLGFVRKKTGSSRSEAVFEARYPGSRRPVLPDDLCWYQDEPTWQMIADSRITSGAEKTSLVVTYTTDYGIDRQVINAAKKSGLNLGGKFEEQHDTIWRLDADFPPLDRPQTG